MLLLKTWESLDIKKDSFNKSLEPLLSRHRIVKSLKSRSWLCSKRWSESTGDLYSTLFLVKYDVPKCSPDLTLKWCSQSWMNNKLDQWYKKSLIDTFLFCWFLICSDYALKN